MFAFSVFIVNILLFIHSRELKRFDSVSRSPIVSLYGETISGLITLRAYGPNIYHYYVNRIYSLINQNTRAFLLSYISERWLSVRLEVCASSIVLFTGLLGIYITTSSNSSTGGIALAALSVSYALQLTGILQYTVRVSIQVESTMTALERITQYDKLFCFHK